MVVIGGSAGSMEVLKILLPSLHHDLKPALIVVTHVHPDSGNFMVKYLDEQSEIRVQQAEDKMIIDGGAYMLPLRTITFWSSGTNLLRCLLMNLSITADHRLTFCSNPQRMSTLKDL